MSKLLAATLVAASLLAAPAVLVPAHALEVDCTDTASAAARPGGFCSQMRSGASLSTPVTPREPMIICVRGQASITLPAGTRVKVAIVTEEYDCDLSGE